MLVLLHSKSSVVNDIPDFVREGVDPDNPHSHSFGPHYADADLTAEQAGRLCYLSGHRPNPKTAANADYLLNICAQKHYSVLGHASASFYIEGISRNCTHEIIRHRWFTFSEVSQRYVDASDFKFVGHPGITAAELDGFDRDQLEFSTQAAKDGYSVLVAALAEKGYKRKEARQAARSVLPGGTETKILMSGNLRAWRDFLAQRLLPAADLEIRNVATVVYDIMKESFPNSFQDFDERGMITTERLIKRLQHRREAALVRRVPAEVALVEFSNGVDKVIKEGLWVLKDDPWIHDQYGSDL